MAARATAPRSLATGTAPRPGCNLSADPMHRLLGRFTRPSLIKPSLPRPGRYSDNPQEHTRKVALVLQSPLRAPLPQAPSDGRVSSSSVAERLQSGSP